MAIYPLTATYKNIKIKRFLKEEFLEVRLLMHP